MKKPKFEEAFEELKQIADNIEQGNINIDDLSQNIKRASELIKLCEATLRKTEDDVVSLKQSFEKPKQ